MNKITRLTESDLHNIIINAARRIIRESSEEDNYTHFAVNKETKKNSQWLGLSWI